MERVVLAWYAWLSGLTQGSALALRSPGGWSLPGPFAVGASLPLLALVVLATVGSGAAEALVGGAPRLERPLRVELLLAGLHDTLVYSGL